LCVSFIIIITLMFSVLFVVIKPGSRVLFSFFLVSIQFDRSFSHFLFSRHQINVGPDPYRNRSISSFFLWCCRPNLITGLSGCFPFFLLVFLFLSFSLLHENFDFCNCRNWFCRRFRVFCLLSVKVCSSYKTHSKTGNLAGVWYVSFL